MIKLICEKCGEDVYSIYCDDSLGNICQDCWNKIEEEQDRENEKSGLMPADDFEFFQMLNIFNK